MVTAPPTPPQHRLKQSLEHPCHDLAFNLGCRNLRRCVILQKMYFCHFRSYIIRLLFIETTIEKCSEYVWNNYIIMPQKYILFNFLRNGKHVFDNDRHDILHAFKLFRAKCQFHKKMLQIVNKRVFWLTYKVRNTGYCTNFQTAYKVIHVDGSTQWPVSSSSEILSGH
jgi:hypothetical protein